MVSSGGTLYVPADGDKPLCCAPTSQWPPWRRFVPSGTAAQATRLNGIISAGLSGRERIIFLPQCDGIVHKQQQTNTKRPSRDAGVVDGSLFLLNVFKFLLCSELHGKNMLNVFN